MPSSGVHGETKTARRLKSQRKCYRVEQRSLRLLYRTTLRITYISRRNEIIIILFNMILADTVAAKCFAYMQWHGNRVWRIATGLEESESSRQATINSWTKKKNTKEMKRWFLGIVCVMLHILCCVSCLSVCSFCRAHTKQCLDM